MLSRHGVVVVFHLDGKVRFHTGECREKMIEDLFGGCVKLAPTGAHLHPAVLVPVIPLRPGPGADRDHVTIVRQIQLKRPSSADASR